MASKDFMVICAPVGLGALDQEVSGGIQGPMTILSTMSSKLTNPAQAYLLEQKWEFK